MRFRLTQPKLPRLTEKQVIAACLDVLALRGYWSARLHAGTFKSADDRRWVKGVAKGTPDYACIHGEYPGFLLELKRPGAKASPEQNQKHFEIRLGFRLAIAVVDSVEALGVWLDQHERRG